MNRIIILLACILVSCSLAPVPENPQPKIRFRLERNHNEQTRARLLMEGADGNMITGSTVLLTTSDNVVHILDFSYNEGCYTGSVPPSSFGEYKVEVISNLLEERLIQKVEFHTLSSVPAIENLVDLSGRRALSGETLDLSQEITVSWKEVPGATVYQISLYREGKEVLLLSSDKNSVTLHPGTLSDTGTYSVTISAQYISGDPLFSQYNYYCFSEVKSPSLIFHGNSQ